MGLTLHILSQISLTVKFSRFSIFNHLCLLLNRQFNNEVQHLGEQKGKCYLEFITLSALKSDAHFIIPSAHSGLPMA